MNRNEKKRQNNINVLFCCAMELFLDRGYEHTTVGEITSKADLAKGTFFNYFPKKIDILHYIGDMNSINLEEEITSGIENLKSTKEIMINILNAISLRGYRYHKILHEVFISGHYIPRSFTDKSAIHYIEKQINRLIEYGKNNGEIRKNIETDDLSHLLANLYSISVMDYLMATSNEVNNHTLTDNMTLYFNILRQGIANE